ncbi:MAG: hypothetical protein HQ581_24865 [Planctomycetes bacterium]|nr:hypothetical protein [Planctomycetota bacterium]
MSLEVVCPNGHHLRVKHDCAGKMGLCPVCKKRVRIPDISEDDILGLLGPHQTNGTSRSEEQVDPEDAHGPAGPHTGTTAPMKCCNRCQREILVDTHICPHCHTYIAGLSDL